jgi:protein subunit release factor A
VSGSNNSATPRRILKSTGSRERDRAGRTATRCKPATGQRDRSRTTNFRNAFCDLGAKLKTWIEAQIRKQAPDVCKVTETIRTYHYADNRVVDHASKLRIAASELDKKFGELVDARRAAMIDQLVQGAK